MYEYAFEQVSFSGVINSSCQAHRDLIARRAAAGWRFVKWIPTSQDNHSGRITSIDLIFEREKENKGE